ncbi:MAG: oxidoreductase [Bacteroidetes bacterium RIFCSPLOWO2_12_FULL_35_15]|nr:MAG: oxidoreductase [Bacteroidetes bacterium RIFCSPLOWO2_12_FULL_35_15]
MKFEKTFTLANELQINRIGYGAMRITGKGIWGPPENRSEAKKVLRRAVELGVNFIDTADSYGPNVSEELIAEALYPYPKNLVIGTKGGFKRSGPNQWEMDSSPAHLEEALNGSLKRLKLNCIDLYQLHRIDPNVPAEITFEFLQKAQKAGKIKHIGLSEVSVDEIKMAQKYFKVVSVQNKYSVDYRNWESVLTFCNHNHIAFIPWNPINAGNVKKIELLNKIAQQHNANAHQIALSWLLHHSNNILLIPGTSSVEHLEENMKCGAIALTEADMRELDKL